MLSHFSEFSTFIINAYIFKCELTVISSEICPSTQCRNTGALELSLHEVILAFLSCSDPYDNP